MTLVADTTQDLSIRCCLLRQLDIAWALTTYHLETLTTEECLWRPAPLGLHVHVQPDGSWRSDWPDREGYDLGPASIAWLTWHLGFWWSMVLDHSFGPAALTREAIRWPGSAVAARAWINDLHTRWRAALLSSTEQDLCSTERARWPIQERPFMDIVAWANLELMKNASELGYARFLYATRAR
jgi:hypothetical protein